jgi:hypothetical protein
MKIFRKSSRYSASLADARPLGVVSARLEPLGAGVDEHRHDVGRVDVGAHQPALLGLADALGAQAHELGIEPAAALVLVEVRPGEQAHDLRVGLQEAK